MTHELVQISQNRNLTLIGVENFFNQMLFSFVYFMIVLNQLQPIGFNRFDLKFVFIDSSYVRLTIAYFMIVLNRFQPVFVLLMGCNRFHSKFVFIGSSYVRLTNDLNFINGF